MSLNDYDEDPFDQQSLRNEIPPEPPPQKRQGRPFLTILLILGVIFLVALLALIFGAPRLLANQRANQLEQAALINAANTATSMAINAQANQLQTQKVIAAYTATPTITQLPAPTRTPTKAVATRTPVVASTGLSPAELATVSALQTQMGTQGTLPPTPTGTSLPETGFADEFGLPLMAVMAIMLILIIIFARRMRVPSH